VGAGRGRDEFAVWRGKEEEEEESLSQSKGLEVGLKRTRRRKRV